MLSFTASYKIVQLWSSFVSASLSIIVTHVINVPAAIWIWKNPHFQLFFPLVAASGVKGSFSCVLPSDFQSDRWEKAEFLSSGYSSNLLTSITWCFCFVVQRIMESQFFSLHFLVWQHRHCSHGGCPVERSSMLLATHCADQMLCAAQEQISSGSVHWCLSHSTQFCADMSWERPVEKPNSQGFSRVKYCEICLP